MKLQINASSTGSYTDTLRAASSDTALEICVSATATGAPVVGSDSASYTVHYTGCGDSASFQMILNNTGQRQP
ncbi:MAG: hypothetical protein U5L96_05455 [Owenweeksia sp.]|nr:hypothetical protein [Owenweeksia sp.]